MKRWLVTSVGLAAVGAVTLAMAFAIAGTPFDSGDDARAQQGESTSEGACADPCVDDGEGADDVALENPDEPMTSGPISIADGMDPDECNFVHNITACEQEAIAVAREDLINRLGISESDVVVVSTQMMEWPDASLGNPQPGMVNAEVVTLGFQVILNADGGDYEYHTDGSRAELLQ